MQMMMIPSHLIHSSNGADAFQHWIYMFYFYSISFCPPFCCFLCHRTENMLYDIIDLDSTRFVSICFECGTKNERKCIDFKWRFFTETTSCDSKPFESLEWYLFLSYETHTFNFQMFVFRAFRVLSVFEWKKRA